MGRLPRRRLLASVSAAVATGLAGCNLPSGGGAATEACTEELSGRIAEDRTLNCRQYRVTDDLRVAPGATLELVAGVTLSFARGAGLVVEPGGSLVASGTDDARVTFTGEAETPGSWRGIEYAPPEEGVGDLELANAVVEYAGADGPAVTVTGTAEGATLSVTNALVHENAGTGIRFGDGARVDEFSGNRITGNGGPPVECPAGMAATLGSDAELSGNDDDAVVVRGGSLEGPHTWTRIGVPYRIARTLPVSGHLTVEAGTTVQFARDQALRVVESGALTAVGGPDQPVVFTGRSPDPGYWAGLWFEGTAREENRLKHAVVEYGGGVPPVFAGTGGNVVVDGPDGSRQSIAVEESVLRESASNGFAFGSGTEVRSFAGNELRNNGSHPGSVSAVAADALAGDTTFANNGRASVLVPGGSVPEGADATWASLSVPYRVAGTQTVAGRLAFAPGATVEFARGTGVEAVDGGTLVVGTGDDETTLTGAANGPGTWNGAWVGEGATGRFQNAVVEGAGGAAPPFADVPAAVAAGATDGDAPTVAFADSVVRESGAVGVYLDSGTTVETMRGGAIVDNEGPPVSVHVSSLPAIDPGTTFDDNADPGVVVRGGGGELVTSGETYTLESLGTPYRFSGSTTVRGTLAVAPGTTVRFARDADLRVLDGGTLTAEGTDDEEIHFRGAEETTGHWRGILVRDSTASFEHAEILHAGGGDRPLPDAAFRACVAVTTSNYRERATLTLRNVRISDSDAYALYIGHFTTVEAENLDVGLARRNHNAEQLDHEPHPVSPSKPHDED